MNVGLNCTNIISYIIKNFCDKIKVILITSFTLVAQKFFKFHSLRISIHRVVKSLVNCVRSEVCLGIKLKKLKNIEL